MKKPFLFPLLILLLLLTACTPVAAPTAADADLSGIKSYLLDFDLTLPDGRILPKLGNLFGVTESTLWGADPDYTVADIQPDLDGNGAVDFDEALPDATGLKAGVETLDSYVRELPHHSWKRFRSARAV